MVEQMNIVSKHKQHTKVIFGQTGEGKSTLLNCIASLGYKEGLKKEFMTSALSESCTSKSQIKTLRIRVPIYGDYSSSGPFAEYDMQLFDTAGAACSTGKDVENHIETYKVAKDNPASALIICNSSDRLNKVTQDEMKFCLAMYGP